METKQNKYKKMLLSTRPKLQSWYVRTYGGGEKYSARHINKRDDSISRDNFKKEKKRKKRSQIGLKSLVE